jgi:hypothetical protein
MLMTVILILLTQAAPVSAKQEKLILKASGTLDSYVEAWSSEIISGKWSIQVKGDELVYKATYKELNLDEIEDSPVGSVDIFTHTLTTDSYEIEGNVLTLEGTMHVKKVWTKLDWTIEVQHWDSDIIITLTPDTFFLDSLPFGAGPGTLDQDWDREGTTKHFKLFEPVRPRLTASGTIDSYVDAESAEIISGKWSVHVKGDELVYKAMYKELNLDEEIEESPVGSVDIFTHTLTTDSYEIDEEVLTFEGLMQVKKRWTTLDWTKEVTYWESYVIITVTPDTFFLNSYPHDPDPEGWDREGTTTHFMLKE